MPNSRRRYLPLLTRIVALNALLLLVALGATIAILAPSRASSLRVDEEGVLVGVVLLAAVILNVLLARRIVGPVQQLTALARRVDLTAPQPHLPIPTPDSEAGELTVAFNEMLARLQAERREATGRVLAAQEAERLRIAQELHDQVGQALTAVLLGIARLKARATKDGPAAAAPQELTDVQEAVRSSLEDVRRIAIELRPEALDDLGLESALAVLGNRLAESTGLKVIQHVDPELPPLSHDAELVVYRVAQEALTNVARHSGASRAELELRRPTPQSITLTVTDHGSGLPDDHRPGAGTRGMQERAALVGGRITIGPPAGPAQTGTEVRLTIPSPTPT